jgi:hypothetical protein
MAFVDENGTLDRASMFEAQSLNARMSYRVTIPELELPKWNAMQKKYRLTGLSLTGYQDMVNATNMSLVDQRTLLQQLKRIATESANLYADQLGLNRSELVTTVKPEGTLSLLPTVSSGLHMNHSDYYIRRIRINSQDPLCKTCESLGYPVFPEVGQDQENPKTKVIEFPVKAPHGRTKYDVSAIEQLETYKMFMEEYVQHNASNTISVRSDREWEEVVDWVYENWDVVIGITFISLDDSFYQLLPYESCSEDEYTIRKQKIKPITYSELAKHESFELFDDVVDESCSSGVCGVR